MLDPSGRHIEVVCQFSHCDKTKCPDLAPPSGSKSLLKRERVCTFLLLASCLRLDVYSQVNESRGSLSAHRKDFARQNLNPL